MKIMYFVLIVLIVLSISTNICCDGKVSYTNYKVFRILPMNWDQVQFLIQLRSWNGYSFWIEPGFPERVVDLQVAPEQQNEFHELLQEAGINYEPIIENVQSLINKQMRFDSRPDGTTFSFKRYHTLEEIYHWMDMVALRSPSVALTIVAGQTFQRRDIQGLRLRFGMQKPAIFLEGGMHPQEWISPATVVYLIDQLINSQVPEVRDLAERYDWYIFPICNPDGFVYTHTTDRLWRKSVSPTEAGPNPENPNCKGIDLNRNFGYKWLELQHLRQTDPCHERFSGYTAFSEPETMALSKYIQNLRGKLLAYISFHSYQQLLTIPYRYTNEHLDNYDDAYAIGSRAIAALFGKHNTHYALGNSAELLYNTGGTSTDWVKGAIKVELVYTYEMRDRGNYGFFLPPEFIQPNSEEVLDSLVAMFQEARRLDYPRDKLISTSVGSDAAASGSRKKSRFKFLQCIGG